MPEKKLRFKVKLVAHDSSSAAGLIFPFDVPEILARGLEFPCVEPSTGFHFARH